MNSNSPLLPVYRRADIRMVRGAGPYLYDDQERRYLDFAAGIATNALGHAHPRLVRALQEQAATLWHCSNLFHTPPLDTFAARLTAASGMDKVFFCSSGTEAVETAIKSIRRYHWAQGAGHRYRIITVAGAFHGRSLGALSACGNPASREGCGPLLPGFDAVAFHDLAALEAAITPETAAVLLETIQGEGGVREHSSAYLRAVRQCCDRHGLLLCCDEIQCGYGRTGTLFAYEEAGIRPDLVTVGKGIGGGFPLAAVLYTGAAAQGMTPGAHGSTYGSNPLAMAVGLAVIEELLAPGFLEQVRATGAHLHAELTAVAADYPALFAGVRGRGLMLGLVLRDVGQKYPFAEALRAAGLLTAPAVTDALRLVPPLNITAEQVQEAVALLRQVAQDWPL